MPTHDKTSDRLRRFTGPSLARIAFPLGGIGTGTVSLGGRGQLCDWEIFNRPAKGRDLPYTFFALWAKAAGKEPVARVLERRILPPYDSGFGLPTGAVSGLPRLAECEFVGGYPTAELSFSDPALPLEVSLEALNPFIPMDDRSSGMPMALFTWSLTNTGAEAVSASLCLSLLNACGYDGVDKLSNRHCAGFGQNQNAFRREAGMAGLAMTTGKYEADSPRHATMALVTPWPDVSVATRWERAGWWDDVQSFWDDFASDGRLTDERPADPTPDGQTDVGSVAALVDVAPGQTVRIPFIIAWHVPNLSNHWNNEEAVKGRPLTTYYASLWPDAWSVAREALDRLPELEAGTDAYRRALFGSTLPDEVLDAASANASILRTTTCMRTGDGRLNAFEGCGDNCGCCPMNCTHVWNYEQAVAHLFPALERTVRYTDFAHNTRPDGNMAFRTLLPLVDQLWEFKPAADGQMGTVLKAYREWQQGAGDDFLQSLWPGIVRALEYAWRPGSWDADGDGVMEGEQHNTYDIEFYGPNTMMGTLYLAALKAGAEMAEAMGEPDRAARFRDLCARGSEATTDRLWNGEYFTQTVIRPEGATEEPRYQYGAGCLSDHLLGQWFAEVVGLGHVLPGDKVRSALKAIHTHNFRPDLSAHASVQRVYALNDEAGLLLCSWPNGGRPTYPFPYADEVWTGIEYQVAAHLLYEGLIEEGLSIVRAVRNRHDGLKRNPWNEFECGHHYARAMASWSLITALSGCVYRAPRQLIRFEPRIRRDAFTCFFTAGTAWGVFEQVGGRAYVAALTIEWGEVTLAEIVLPQSPSGHVVARLNGATVAARRTDGGSFLLEGGVQLCAGDALTLTVA
ncbi:MAG: GH116 family glycosyl-hydrolase [Armatimonadetes bacterium]|nr:GH116 family glycosyl-hydrolase [Armatimonadota bacterium]